MASAVKAGIGRLEDKWHEARLIPTTGIGGQDEQEQRATSSLLAVMRSVPAFGRALLVHLSAPAGRISTYSEVRFQNEDLKVSRPDGAILVERGQTAWRCLVEVKTGDVPLRADQVSAYLEVARLNGIQAVLTISNQVTSSPSESPVTLEQRRGTKKAALYHLSWWHILTEAIDQHRHKGVTDPDQAWILGELIAYLDNERSGASGFVDLGDKWVLVRDASRAQTLGASDAGAQDVAGRWEQFVQHLALGLRQDLGREVIPIWPARLDAAARREDIVRRLAEAGRLEATIKVPGAAAPVGMVVDLRTRQVTTGVDIAAPRDGRARTRITWLLRQLKDAPPALRLDATFPLAKETTSELLASALENPDRLLMSADPRREPRTFKVAWTREMGLKRGKASGSFIYEAKLQMTDFYRLVVQQLKPWQAGAPKLPSPSDEARPEASPRPPDFTAEGTREPGEGVDPEALP